MVSRLGPTSTDFSLVVADGSTWLGEIDVYEAATIIARFNDISTWELTLPTASTAATLFLEAAQPRLIVNSAPGVVFRSGPVVRFERTVDVDGDMLVLSGTDDMVWLARRLAHPDPSKPAPPYNGQAYDTRTGPSSQVIAGFVDANAGPAATPNRRVPGLVVPVPAPLGPVVKVSARYQNLLELVQRQAARARLGIEIRDLVFSVFQPAGPKAVFSQELGTLAGWVESRESPELNHVYVAGGGVGVNRLIREYSDTASLTEWGRVEAFDDRRDTTDTAELDEAGAEALADGIPAPELELAVLDTAAQRFLVDWQLGDKATATVNGHVVTDVIREVTLQLDGNAPPMVTPVIGGRP